jgi:undecaprenyl-diphosphatase
MSGGWDIDLVIWANQWIQQGSALPTLLRPLMALLSWRFLLFFPLGFVLLAALFRRTPSWTTLALGCGLAVLLVDPTFHNILKPAIGRVRPCHMHDAINALERCGSGFSMPSNHAGNGAALATLLIALLPLRWWGLPLLLIPGLGIGLSRIFLGVHYPSDVAVGWMLGAGAGGLAAWLALRIMAWARARNWLKPESRWWLRPGLCP